jgi:uncharacterized protein YdhG (YjbR/CyaY superfamily)
MNIKPPEDISPSLDSIDAYIESFPADIQEKLQAIRTTIRSVIPEAQEKISYQMPTFFYKGNLVHFAAFRNHIGFYPTPSGTDTFAAEIAKYKHSKGAVQFPINEPMPLDLIARITAYRVKDNEAKELARKNDKALKCKNKE